MAKKKASPSDVKKYTSSVLKSGSKGPAVGYLQEQLNQNGAKLSIDEDYGSNTKNAVKAYQKKQKLTTDGIAGKNTWGALSGKKNATADKAKRKKDEDDQRDPKQRDEKEADARSAGQCTINVRVICRTSRRGMRPVQGANVKIGKAKKRTRTNGNASLQVRPGRYKAEVTKRGYRLDSDNKGFDIRVSRGSLDVCIEMVADRK